jgi:putative redox protein
MNCLPSPEAIQAALSPGFTAGPDDRWVASPIRAMSQPTPTAPGPNSAQCSLRARGRVLRRPRPELINARLARVRPPRFSAAGSGKVAGMATDSAHREVTVQRVSTGTFTAVNPRGGRIPVGTGGDGDFTPAELLLAAIGSCTSMDVDALTSRRAQPAAFEVVVGADKVRDGSGNHLTDIEVTFRVTFPAGEPGDAARALLPDMVKKSHDRLCTVSRTVELGTPITSRIEPA